MNGFGCFRGLDLCAQQGAQCREHGILCCDAGRKGVIKILRYAVSKLCKAGVFQQQVDHLCIDTSCVEVLCGFYGQAKAAKDISLRRKPVYQGDLDDIEMYFMAAVKEIKKGIGSHYAEQEAMSKKVAEKMFNELTKGQDVQHPTITAEQLTDAMLDSVSGMEGATPEALEQLRSGLLGILQSAADQENAHEADE